MSTPLQGFQTPLRVENVDAKRWVLTDRLDWIGWQGDPFSVDKGEFTDFATVPWWTQAIIPRTGTWTKAAVLHDKMCDQLNTYRKLKREYDRLTSESPGFTTALVVPLKPLYNAVDTDAVFRKNARALGTDPIRSELLWFGVRCGALANPARRAGWVRTFPRWFADLIWILAVLVAVIAGLSWLWPW